MKSLEGRHILVTRARAQASGFAARLKKLGATVSECPTIRIVPPKSFRALDQAVQSLNDFDWLIFTSANSVEFFALRMSKFSVSFPKHLKTCAIGPATARQMRAYKFPVHRVSKKFVGEGVLDSFKNVKGLRFLIPRAAVARDVLPQGLQRRGARVQIVEAYRTQTDRSQQTRLLRLLAQRKINCVTFTASSTVHNFFALIGAAGKKLTLRQSNLRAASIGPITTAALREHHWPPAIAAANPTTQELARAIARFYGKNK